MDALPRPDWRWGRGSIDASRSPRFLAVYRKSGGGIDSAFVSWDSRSHEASPGEHEGRASGDDHARRSPLQRYSISSCLTPPSPGTRSQTKISRTIDRLNTLPPRPAVLDAINGLNSEHRFLSDMYWSCGLTANRASLCAALRTGATRLLYQLGQLAAGTRDRAADHQELLRRLSQEMPTYGCPRCSIR